MAIQFEKYAQEGQHFVNDLASKLGHPDEKGRAGIILRSVLHVLRDRLTIQESLHFLAQLPMSLKAIYVDNWKYRETPLRLRTKDDFIDEVKKHQAQYGEREFDWNMPTEEIIQTVLSCLGEYISRSEFDDIIAQMPLELKEMFYEGIKNS